MIIIISGFAGSGKSTLAEKLASHFKLKCVHASGILKQLREKSIDDIRAEKAEKGTGFWEGAGGEGMMKARQENGGMDRQLDKKLLEIIEAGNVVLDSKTMGYLSGKGIKVWLDASLETRAKRVAERDGLDAKAVKEKLAKRDETDIAIYRKLYGFTLGEGVKERFDIVIDTHSFGIDKTFETAAAKIGKLEKQKSKKGGKKQSAK